MPEIRDTEDAFLTAYDTVGSDPVGYPYGQLPQYSWNDIPMAQTAYGATFGQGDDDGWENGLGRLGAREMAHLRRWLWLLPPMERKLVKKELVNDPKKMMQVIEPLLARADFRDAVSKSALRAVANEFDGTLYPEMAGYWPILRMAVHQIAADTANQITKLVEGMSPEERLAALAKIGAGTRGISGLGAEAAAAPDIYSTLVNVIGNLATNIATTRITTQAATDVAKIQTQAAVQQTALQARLAEAQAALAAAGGAITSAGRSAMAAEVGGIPLPLIIGGVAAAGLVAFFALRK